MALGDNVQVTEGSGKRLAAGATYTENGQTVRDEKAIIGEQYLASYVIRTAATSVATLDSHVLQVMAGASLLVYIRRIRVFQLGLATTAAHCHWDLVRLSTAGTGGTAITPAPLDTTDSASGATAMTLPTAKGTETTTVGVAGSFFNQTASAGNPASRSLVAEWDFDEMLRTKALRIPAGAANGMALKNRTAIAAATVLVECTLVEATF